jgi:enamine deaminase RidA (YjgF/YER057c/UK114 family)
MAGEATGRRRFSSGSPFESEFGFTRAVQVGDRVLVSGTAPIWPDGGCPPEADVQARRCFEIVLQAVAKAGGTAADVVRTRMYITDAADGAAVGRVHGEIFGAHRPASTLVVVAGLLDPRWKIEVEAEALLTPG